MDDHYNNITSFHIQFAFVFCYLIQCRENLDTFTQCAHFLLLQNKLPKPWKPKQMYDVTVSMGSGG